MRTTPITALALLALLLAACAGAPAGASPSETATADHEAVDHESASPSPDETEEAEESDDEEESRNPDSLYGGGIDDEYGQLGGGDTPTEAPPAGEGEEVTLTVAGFAFPDDVTVGAGSTVTFVNQDPGPHTVTHGSDGVAATDAAFDEDLPGGASVEITFDEPGTYQITCRLHPSMNMTITVEG